MHEYLKFFGTNNQQKIGRFLIYERDLINEWKYADSLGLGFFAAFGANKTFEYTGNIQVSIILGCIIAVGGGCLRDILCGRTPIIFTKEIYASAAIIGATIEVLGSSGVISSVYSIWIAIFACTSIRLISLYYGLNLPTIKLK